jgi:Hypoxia induced protein conserved region
MALGGAAMDPLLIIIVLALLATIGTMVLGLLAMSGGDSVDRAFSTPLMWTRVGLQAFTLLLLVVAFLLR